MPATGGEPQAGHWPESAGSSWATSRRAAMRVQATCNAAATNTISAASEDFTSPCRKRSASASRSSAVAAASAVRACRAASGRPATSMRSRMRASATRQLSSRLRDPGSSGAPFVGPGSVPGGRPASASCWAATRAASMRKKPSSSWPGASAPRRSARLAKTVTRSGSLTGSLSANDPTVLSGIAQGLPTSWRNHLRWCFQLQPRVTEPRVMARKVPLTQIAA